MMTDPIADMLTRLRNANTAMHDEVRMPSSKQKVALAEILQGEGYISGYEVAPSPKGVGDIAHHRDEVLAGPRSHDLGHPAGFDAGPAGVPQGRQPCRACSAASASLSCPPLRD